jgi:hypothetical protein
MISQWHPYIYPLHICPPTQKDCCLRMYFVQETCCHLKTLADDFQPGDVLASSMCWLADTLQVALNSTHNCITAWPQHQAFEVSSDCSLLLQHHPNLQHVAHELQHQLGSLIAASNSRTATRQQVLEHSYAVLEICQLQQQQQQQEEGDHFLSNLPAPGQNTLQWHTQLLREAKLQPAVDSCIALQRTAVQLLLLCCRLTRCYQPAASAYMCAVEQPAAATARQLGLEEALAAMPHEAAELLQPIKMLQQQLPYAVAAVANRQWLQLQCRLNAVAGPVALLQAGDQQLFATGRAFLPASYLGLRFADCLVAMKESLFSSEQPAQALDAASSPSRWLEGCVASRHLNAADVAVLQQLLNSFCSLMELDVMIPHEAALAVSSGADKLLDDFKAALGSCTEQLTRGRVGLEACCRLLSERGELLQKEVLKAEVSLVGRAFKYQVNST